MDPVYPLVWSVLGGPTRTGLRLKCNSVGREPRVRSNPDRVGGKSELFYIGKPYKDKPTGDYIKSDADRTDHRPGMGQAEPNHAK